MAAVHLNVMELKRYGQHGFEPLFAIFSPHHHRIAELVGVLIDNTIEFGLRHRRCADNHPVVERTAFTIVGGFRGQVEIIAVEPLQIIGKRNVAGVETSLSILHDYVDGEAVVAEKFPVFGQRKELLHPTRRLADAPTQEHREF